MEENERQQVRVARRGTVQNSEQDTAPAEPRQTVSRVDGAIARGKALLDALEALFQDAKQIPMTKTRLISESAFQDAIGQLRMSMPDMVREAADVLARQQEILDSARAEAQAKKDEADRYDREHRDAADSYDKQTRSDAESFRMQLMNRAQEDAKAMQADAETRAKQILDSANQQAAGLVEDNEITRRAKAYAMELQDSAKSQADAMYEAARKQTDLMLSGAVGSLSRSANELAKLRDTLLSGNAGQQDNQG